MVENLYIAIGREDGTGGNKRGQGFKMNFVLNSSIIAKLFIDEKDSDMAAKLLEKNNLKPEEEMRKGVWKEFSTC